MCLQIQKKILETIHHEKDELHNFGHCGNNGK
jgi:hypothetical protein